MPCYQPLLAFKTTDGQIVFGESRARDASYSLWLACGQCVGCRLERSRQWAVRCMHEASLSESNCFVTLTYSSEHVPVGRSLEYSHFQAWMKRLRARFSCVRIRFYMCGEYGEEFDRPHYHACLFNFDFPDKVYLAKSPLGFKLYRSAILEDLWPFGFSSVGSVTFESAAYVARYCMKKITGPKAAAHYEVLNVETGEVSERVAEFNHMSKGVGAGWLERFHSDVYPHGTVVVRGVECRPPRYYDLRFKERDGFGFDDMQYGRHVEALARAADNVPQRLHVKEQVAQARVSRLRRSI